MNNSLGDLAEQVTQKLVTDTEAPVVEASVITEEASLTNSMFTKIRFAWRPEDRAALEKIRVAADAAFEEAFADSITIIDNFYLQLRVPRQREVDGVRVVVKDATDRVVWETDDAGRPIERWDQITGQDVEYTLACLQRVRFALSEQVNQLKLEALYARYVAGDIHDDAWNSVMDGTQGDKTAKANRENRVDRYHAFFRFYLYSMAETFLVEINAFYRLLEKIRGWQLGNRYA